MTKPTLSESRTHLNLPLPDLKILKKTEKYDPSKDNKLTWAPKVHNFRGSDSAKLRQIEDIFKKHLADLADLQTVPVNLVK